MSAFLALLDVLAIPLALAWCSADFQTRDEASRWAKDHRPAVVLALRLADHPEPEVAMRADEVLRARHCPARPGVLFAAALALAHPDEREATAEPLVVWWLDRGRLGEFRRLAVLLGLMDHADWIQWDSEPDFWRPASELARSGIVRLRNRMGTGAGSEDEHP